MYSIGVCKRLSNSIHLKSKKVLQYLLESVRASAVFVLGVVVLHYLLESVRASAVFVLGVVAAVVVTVLLRVLEEAAVLAVLDNGNTSSSGTAVIGS